MDNTELLQRMQAVDTAKKSTMSSWVLLLVSLVLFVGASSFAWDLSFIIDLVLAILLHEIGHVIAMKCCGYKNVSMMFIPFLGGMAKGTPREENSVMNIIVSLAGPIFGLICAIVFSVVATALDAPRDLWLNFVVISLFLNIFNLLPFMPLDGGQVVNELILSRSPKAELVFKLIGAAALGYLAYDAGSIILGIFVGLILMGIGPQYQMGMLIQHLRKQPHINPAQPTEDDVAIAREQLEKRLPMYQNEQAADRHLPGAMATVFSAMQKRYPSFLAGIALGVVYVACLVGMPLAGLAYFAAQRGVSIIELLQRLAGSLGG